MPITVKHSKVSTIPDDADTSLVRPSDWNADHTLVGLGTMAEQNANNVNITGGTITGVTGLGDVVGPASSTDNAIARFDSTTGKLLQNSVVTIGDTGATTGVTTFAASTSVTTPIVQATNSAGLALRNSSGTTQMSVGAGGGDNMSINVSTNLNGTNAQIDISPTGTGHVHIKPTGVNSVEIAPTFVGEMDNVTIGATTPSTGSFTTVGIDTSGTDAQIAPNTGITGWDYSGLSKSIGAEESAPNGLFFSPDGLNMYVNGATGDDVNQYTLSTAWNVSTATYLQLFSTAAQDTAPVDIFFKPDGLSMFIMGQTNDTVFQYTLSSAWDISTASYASKSFSVTSQETTPTGLWFKSDGTVMYAIGTISDTVFQYNLGTAWDVSTASYASISFSVASQESSPSQLNLSADGTKMWIIGSSGDDINEYTLGTAWNVSTATFVNNFYVGFQETNPTGLFIDSTAANRVYIVGQTNDTVFQYNTATNSISAVTDVFNTTSNARVQGNLAVQGNANIDGTLAVLGVSSLGTTTVSGTLTSNSTTTLATLTSAQTVALGAGATVSGALKTLNIGTAGVSGSTTTINIGSAVSGATSTTTLNGLVIDSISAAVSAAGATQGTATGLVSNINNVTVVAVGAAGVRLPTAVAGMRILIRNSDSADVLSIYPATGGQINALGNNTASTLAAGLTVELVATTATQWYTF